MKWPTFSEDLGDKALKTREVIKVMSILNILQEPILENLWLAINNKYFKKAQSIIKKPLKKPK